MICLRSARPDDLPFLQEMLYEAVYWRMIARGDGPSLEDGLALPEVRHSLANWGERTGDTAVIATFDVTPVGAAWFRFWTDKHHIRGYIDAAFPTLVIAVHRDVRRQGVGKRLLSWLVDRALESGTPGLSLMVSKDNHAIHLYRDRAFLDYAEQDDAVLMLRRLA